MVPFTSIKRPIPVVCLIIDSDIFINKTTRPNRCTLKLHWCKGLGTTLQSGPFPFVSQSRCSAPPEGVYKTVHRYSKGQNIMKTAFWLGSEKALLFFSFLSFFFIAKRVVRNPVTALLWFLSHSLLPHWLSHVKRWWYPGLKPYYFHRNVSIPSVIVLWWVLHHYWPVAALPLIVYEQVMTDFCHSWMVEWLHFDVITEINGFVTATKLETTNNFLLLQPEILLQQPNILL